MLKIDFLPVKTRNLFDLIRRDPLLSCFTLIGGTSLSLQIGHRISEDLDFWLPYDKLDKNRISEFSDALKKSGISVQLVTPHAKIVAARINGIDLLSHAQDYVIGGTKVTFFARNDVPYRHFNTLKRITSESSFSIMGEEGLFAMKSHVLMERVKSRDLYDLKTFLSRGKKIFDIFESGIASDPAYSVECAKAILAGEVPFSADDEGFENIGIQETIEDVQHYLRSLVNQYEVIEARRIRDEFGENGLDEPSP